VVVAAGSAPGSTSLALALLSGPCAGGSWCAVVGAPDLGLVAAAQSGLDLERLALVPSPGPTWPVVTAALIEGFDVVLLSPPSRTSQPDARKLEARARERGAVLAVLGDWPGSADMRLRVTGGSWRGLDDGFGYLAGREVEVEAAGRGAASRTRRARLWLGGSPVAPLVTSPVAPLVTPPATPFELVDDVVPTAAGADSWQIQGA
jgi:membrane protein implicated in regulation of membrane protease activity